jgi:hypothetical protein
MNERCRLQKTPCGKLSPVKLKLYGVVLQNIKVFGISVAPQPSRVSREPIRTAPDRSYQEQHASAYRERLIAGQQPIDFGDVMRGGYGMARRSPPRKVTWFEPVPPWLARNTTSCRLSRSVAASAARCAPIAASSSPAR